MNFAPLRIIFERSARARFTRHSLVALVILTGTCGILAQGVPLPAEEDPLATLRPGHPRLLIDESTWDRLRTQAAEDADYRAFTEALIAEARERISAEPPRRVLEGRRLLGVSRRVLADATAFSAAWRFTGDVAFVAAAERNLLAAAAFTDWNPAHFLDVAEMTTALALGYDWLHRDLPPVTRAVLRRAIADKGVRPALEPDAPGNWWQTREMNWNQICLAGMTIGALAIAEDEPELARRALALLRRGQAHGLAAYSPAGVYPEGPSYWRYGTHYTALTISSLESALGTSELLKAPAAFYESARVQALLTAPSGLTFNFSDGSAAPSPDPLLFWFAWRLNEPSLHASQRRFYLRSATLPRRGESLRSDVFALLHWRTPPAPASSGWTAWLGEGKVPLAVFRGPAAANGAFYLAIKGGSASSSHAHMDGGSFVLEIDGVRWAHDLGAQNYNELEKRGIRLWDSGSGGGRWTIFRYTNLAHNTLAIDGEPHDPRGSVGLTDFSAATGHLGVRANLEPVLAGKTARATRRFKPHEDGRGLTIEDRLAGLRPGARIRWTMVTTADVELGESRAILRQDGRQLSIRFSAPCGVELGIRPAQGPADWDAPANGFRLLTAEAVAPDSGEVDLDAEFLAP